VRSVDIHPLVSQWGRFGLYSFFIDGREPAIIDTGVASSPVEGISPALQALGRRIEDVRWIILTHGHIDHIGGAHALWELTGRRAKVVIHEADAPFLRSRRSHVEEYLAARGRYIQDPEGEARLTAAGLAAISGEMEPDRVVRHGDELRLGPDVTLTVHSMPGHTAGSVAYVVEGQRDVFAGDAVQIHGAANGFPSYVDPDAYRASLVHLRDQVKPNRLFLGHAYRSQGCESLGVELNREQAALKIQESIDIEARVRAATNDPGRDGSDMPHAMHSPFCCIAQQLAYNGDPRLEPSPFFTTLHGYFHLGDRA
jgi:glyoxylase-like metal-dependent hydrolase (beta-lactamase superfamily II)